MVKRGFSATKRIKSDWRNRLNEETLDNLMRTFFLNEQKVGCCCKKEQIQYKRSRDK